jgi:hypothetical protein
MILYEVKDFMVKEGMPRQARLDALGTLHHVMVRGIEGTPIFKDKEDRRRDGDVL